MHRFTSCLSEVACADEVRLAVGLQLSVSSPAVKMRTLKKLAHKTSLQLNYVLEGLGYGSIWSNMTFLRYTFNL